MACAPSVSRGAEAICAQPGRNLSQKGACAPRSTATRSQNRAAPAGEDARAGASRPPHAQPLVIARPAVHKIWAAACGVFCGGYIPAILLWASALASEGVHSDREIASAQVREEHRWGICSRPKTGLVRDDRGPRLFRRHRGYTPPSRHAAPACGRPSACPTRLFRTTAAPGWEPGTVPAREFGLFSLNRDVLCLASL
jgi:hypothetical protein